MAELGGNWRNLAELMGRNYVEELCRGTCRELGGTWRNLVELGGTWRNLWGETVWRNYVEELGGTWRNLGEKLCGGLVEERVEELVGRNCVEELVGRTVWRTV